MGSQFLPLFQIAGVENWILTEPGRYNKRIRGFGRFGESPIARGPVEFAESARNLHETFCNRLAV